MINEDIPLVSVVIPCRNEQQHIEECISSLMNGTYKNIQVLAVDGASDDGTQVVIDHLAAKDARVQRLNNPARSTPKALNQGIRAALGNYIAILGAHSRPSLDWVESAVDALTSHPAVAAVGGVLETTSITAVGRVMAAVQSTRFGIGNAHFRVGGQAGVCDTVVFGCYRRRVFEEYGMFDEELPTNQDDEFNLRLLSAGEKLYFEPSIRCVYYARAAVRPFLNQYWRYGSFKCAVFIRNRRIGAIRQLAPAAWVALVASTVWFRTTPVGTALWALLWVYFGLGICQTAAIMGRLGVVGALYLPLAVSVHTAYGAGFWYGLFRSLITPLWRRGS